MVHNFGYIYIYNINQGPNNDLWTNRIEEHGVKHTKTQWGTISLVLAEGLLYKAALKNKDNKYFCLLSESDIPLWTFPEFYNYLNTKNKSYMVIDSARGDEDVYLDCFPERYIPSTNEARSRKHRDHRKIIIKNAHQWENTSS